MHKVVLGTKLVVPLILFSAFLIMQANFLVLPALAIYIAKDLTLSNHDLSILLATFSIAVALSNFGWSRVLDRFNRKSILLAGGFLVSVVFVLTAIASDFNELFLSRVAMAAIMPLMGATILPFVADIYAPTERPKIMGYVMSAGYVVSLIVIPVVVLVSDHYSWRFVGFGLAAFTATVFVIAYFCLPRPDTPKPKQEKSKPKFNIFSFENRPILSNLLRKFLQTAGIFTVFSVYPTWLSSSADGVSYESSTMAAIFFVAGAMGFAGSMVAGRVNDFFKRIMTRTESLTITTLLCVAFCVVVPIFGKSAQYYQFISYAPMVFFQSIAVVLLMNSLITSVGPAERGFINAMSNIAFQAGIAFGSYFGFWILAQGSILLVFVVAGLLLFSSTLNFFQFRKQTK